MDTNNDSPQLNPVAANQLREATRRVLPPSPSPEVIECGLAAFKANRHTRKQTAHRRRTRLPLWSTLVASLLVMAILAYWQFARASVDDAQQYATGRGEQSTITLRDGSRMVLAPASVALVTIGRDGERSVQLTGSAYFDVTPDAKRGFVVRAGTSTTTVLGTQFVVRKYAEDSAATVAVTQGRVSVNALLLVPGEMATVGLSGHINKRAFSESDATIAWTEGRLVFRNIRLSDLAAEINRWYGLHVVITDTALASRKVNVTLDRGELTPQRLDVLASGIDANVMLSDSIVAMSPR